MSDRWGLADDELVSDLSYVLVKDTPTGMTGSASAPMVCPFPVIEQRLRAVGAARRRLGSAVSPQPVRCTMRADPLDYAWGTSRDGKASCADLAWLWRAHLGHGLEIVTEGSLGRPLGTTVLTAFRLLPALLSGITLRVAVGYGSEQRTEHVAEDLKLLMPLWRWDAVDAVGQPRPRSRLLLEVVYVDQAENAALTLITSVLEAAGVTAPVRTRLLSDKRRLIRRPYPATDPPQAGYGITTRGTAFVVDPGAKRARTLYGRDQSPRRWPDMPAPALSVSDAEHVAAEHDSASSRDVSATTRATE